MHIPATALFKLTIEMSVLPITFRKLKAEVNIYIVGCGGLVQRVG